MCGGGPPPGTSCDSTALTTPPVSRPWMRMTIGMPRTFIFLPPSDGIWIGFINIGGDVLLSCAGWQDQQSVQLERDGRAERNGCIHGDSYVVGGERLRDYGAL